MLLSDFNKIELNYCPYVSKEKFWFENNKVNFWYRIAMDFHAYQSDIDNSYETSYQVFLVVDEKSIHPNYKNCHFPQIECGFLLKETVKKGSYREEYMMKILDSAMRLKIDNKIKIGGYQKIKGILSGESYCI